MDNMQMVEKLREYADVTYEEAKAALDEANGDLLEAVIILERQGKTKQPEQSTYTTKAEEQPQYQDESNSRRRRHRIVLERRQGEL